jgi:endoglucanase
VDLLSEPGRRRRARASLAALTVALAVLVPAAPVDAGPAAAPMQGRVARVNPADPANPGNPLAGRAWGVYRGLADPAWGPYLAAAGAEKDALATIALAPKAKFFGKWIPNDQITRKVADYIASATRADPEALVQMTLFRMVPWEREACRRLPTAAEQASYKEFVDRFAAAIGETNAAVVVQPDGPFARCAPGGSRLPSRLIAYAVRRLETQPNTSAYVEMGSADWFRDDIADAVRLLVRGGVADARGFALDTSHFDSTARQVAFGSRIVDALAERGIPGAHFVVDTSDNGRPFTGAYFHQTHPQQVPVGEAEACRTTSERRCVTLGIPPTTDVANQRWGLSPELRRLASRHVDGYLWVSRPWLYHQSGAFDLQRALDLVRTWRYAS